MKLNNFCYEYILHIFTVRYSTCIIAYALCTQVQVSCECWQQQVSSDMTDVEAEYGLMSHQTHHRSYRDGFLQVR